MEKFIAYEKLSKKEQKKLNAAKRGSWGLVKPQMYLTMIWLMSWPRFWQGIR